MCGGFVMFTMDELLSKRNQRMAFEHLDYKRKGIGYDGMSIVAFKEYWTMNCERIENEMRTGCYIPGVVKNYEIINGHGKKRVISNMTMTDKFITRFVFFKARGWYLLPEPKDLQKMN